MNKKNNQITFNIFCSHYFPHVGGIEVFVENFATVLVSRGFAVNIITSNSDDRKFFQKIKGINIFRLRSLSLLNGRFPVPYFLPEFITLYKHCFNNKKTFVIANTRFFLTSFLGVFFGKISNSRMIVIDHGSGHFAYSNKIINLLSHLYEHFISFILNLFNPDFYGVSLASNEWLKHFNIKPKGILYNGFISHKVSGDPIFWHNKWDKKKIIFYAGRLIEEKGIFELIDGFNIFSKKNDSYILLLAGSGELEGKIVQLSQSNRRLFFLGRLSREDVFYCLSKTNIFVNPSNYPEGLPTILLEAGSFGIPVISTPNGGAREIIFNKKTGILINVGKSKEISESLFWIDKNYNKAVKMGKSLQQILYKKFSFEKVIEDFLLNNKII